MLLVLLASMVRTWKQALCWLLGRSVPKQAGKESCENLAHDVDKEEKSGVVVIINAFFMEQISQVASTGVGVVVDGVVAGCCSFFDSFLFLASSTIQGTLSAELKRATKRSLPVVC